MRKVKFGILICLISLIFINEIKLLKADFNISEESDFIVGDAKFIFVVNITGSNPTNGGSSYSIMYDLNKNVMNHYNVTVEMKIITDSWCPMLPDDESIAFSNDHLMENDIISDTEEHYMVYNTSINMSIYIYESGIYPLQLEDELLLKIRIDASGVDYYPCDFLMFPIYNSLSGTFTCFIMPGYNIEIILGSIFVTCILIFMIIRKKITFQTSNKLK